MSNNAIDDIKMMIEVINSSFDAGKREGLDTAYEWLKEKESVDDSIIEEFFKEFVKSKDNE